MLLAQYGSDGRPENRSGRQLIANAFCDNFNDPRELTATLQDMRRARAFIRQATGRSWVWSAIAGRLAVGRNQLRQRLRGDPTVAEGDELAPTYTG
jgi:hypothetical protein